MDSFEIFIEKFTITGGSITTAVVIPLPFPLCHWMSHLSREAQYLHLQNELACIFVQMFICLRGSILITLVIPLFWESFSNDIFLAPVLHLKVPCYFPIFHLLLATLSDRRMKNIMCITFSLFSLKSPIKNSIFLFDIRITSLFHLNFGLFNLPSFSPGTSGLFLTLSPFNIESTLPWKMRTGQVQEVVWKTKPT